MSNYDEADGKRLLQIVPEIMAKVSHLPVPEGIVCLAAALAVVLKMSAQQDEAGTVFDAKLLAQGLQTASNFTQNLPFNLCQQLMADTGEILKENKQEVWMH